MKAYIVIVVAVHAQIDKEIVCQGIRQVPPVQL